jgi:hypothetical protein
MSSPPTDKLYTLIVSPGFSDLMDPLLPIEEDSNNGYSYRESSNGCVTESIKQNSTLYKFKSLMRIKIAICKIGFGYAFNIYDHDGNSVDQSIFKR